MVQSSNGKGTGCNYDIVGSSSDRATLMQRLWASY